MFLGNLFGNSIDGDEKIIDYDLKGNGEDGLHEGESSDFEDWWGVERDNGKTSDSHVCGECAGAKLHLHHQPYPTFHLVDWLPTT